MDVFSLCPLPACALVFRPREDRFTLMAACKATYALAPGTLMPIEPQEPMHERDVYWEDDPRKSLYAPSDLTPVKPRADVLVVGYAYAPRKEPVRKLVAQVVAGKISKSIEAHCQRLFTPEGALRDGAAWTRMSLRYERAAAGPDNPVGLRADAPPDAYGQRAAPNLQPVGLRLTQPTEIVPAVGLGPIARTWPARRERLGARVATWSDERWPKDPLGEHFDLGFFQAAPADQQIEALLPGEQVLLDHLHPDHPRLIFQLPASFPRAFVERPRHEAREIAMRADTLWIDTARAIVTLTLRAEWPLERADEDGRLILALDAPGERLTPRQAVERAPAARPVPLAALAPVPEPEVDVDDTEVTWRRPQPVQVTRARPMDHEENTLSVVRPLAGAAPLPFRKSEPGPPPRAAVATAPPTAPPSRPAEEQTRRMSVEDMVPSSGLPPWLDPPQAQVAPPPPPFRPPPVPSKPATISPPFRSAPAPPPAPALVTPLARAPQDLAAAAFVGAVAASDAAADRFAADERPAPPSRSGSTTAVSGAPAASTAPAKTVPLELVFFDPNCGAALKKNPEWASLMSAPKKPVPRKTSLLGLSFATEDEASASGSLSKADVLAILSTAAPATAQSLHEAMVAYLEAAGAAPPPLGLLAGELSFPFDPVEELNAVLQAASPLSANDKRLKETLDAIAEVMKTPLDGAPDVAESLTKQVREAWAKANRILPADYLFTRTERTLLERRQYQRRDIMDGSWIRALLSIDAGGEPIPIYLPMHLYRRLPLFKRFPARLLGETLPQQDQYETCPMAVRAVALSRVLPSLSRAPSR